MKETQNKRKTGSQYEEKACQYLKNQGIQVIERNFRCKMGEIDLIARDGRYLVFVEVKFRSSTWAGGSLYAVDRRKQKTIGRVAEYYLLSKGLSDDIPCRFDVIGFEMGKTLWIKNAFDFSG